MFKNLTNTEYLDLLRKKYICWLTENEATEIFKSLIFSYICKHFGIDRQEWKTSDSLKITQLLEKSSKSCPYKLNLRLQKQPSSFATQQVQSPCTVGQGVRVSGQSSPLILHTLSRNEGLWRWVHRSDPIGLLNMQQIFCMHAEY